MRLSSSRPLAALVALLLGAALGAAEGHPTTLVKTANIRFGPDMSAPAAGTLPAGTAIEVIEPAKAGWLMIRFPRGCTAWMHEKVLQKAEDGKSFTVLEDKARVRADATLGSAIVAELALGEKVEATGKQNGQWWSVYPANAVAYVSAKLVDRAKLPVEAGGVAAGAVAAAGGAEAEPDPVDDYLARLWSRAQQTYDEYKAIANSDNARALGLDWPGLSDQLGQVVEKHASRVIQLQAQRLKNGVDKVVDAQRRSGNHPSVTVAEPAAAPTKVSVKPKPVEATKPKPAPIPAKPEQPVTVKPERPIDTPKPDAPKPDAPTPDAPKPAPTTDRPVVDAPPKADPPAKAGVNDLLSAPGGFTIEGWLEARDVPEVGAAHVIIDANSNVVAYLKPKPGVNLQLSEYFWRLVAVSGAKVADHDGAPVLVIESVSMPGR